MSLYSKIYYSSTATRPTNGHIFFSLLRFQIYLLGLLNTFQSIMARTSSSDENQTLKTTGDNQQEVGDWFAHFLVSQQKPEEHIEKNFIVHSCEVRIKNNEEKCIFEKNYNQEEIEVKSGETPHYMFSELKLRIPGTVPAFVLPNTLMNGYSIEFHLEYTPLGEEARVGALIKAKHQESHPGGVIFEKSPLEPYTLANPER